MLRRLNKLGQSTGEYAVMFAIVLGAIIAVQTMVRRQFQQGFKTGTDYLVLKAECELSKVPGAVIAADVPGLATQDVRESKQKTEITADVTVKEFAGTETADADYYKISSDDQQTTTLDGSYTKIKYED